MALLADILLILIGFGIGYAEAQIRLVSRAGYWWRRFNAWRKG